MNEKDLFKNIIEQNTMKKDDILTSILTKAQRQTKIETQTETANTKGRVNFKRIVKFTLPVAMVLAIVFISIFNMPIFLKNPENDNIIVDTDSNTDTAGEILKSGNWFTLSVYAADDEANQSNSDDVMGNKIELQKDIQAKLPLGWAGGSWAYFGDDMYWKSNIQPIKLTIEGDNIKSISFTSENCSLTKNNVYAAEISEDIIPYESVIERSPDGEGLWTSLNLIDYWTSGVLDEIKEKYFQGMSVHSEAFFDEYVWQCIQSEENKEKGIWMLYAIQMYNDIGKEVEVSPSKIGIIHEPKTPPSKNITIYRENTDQNIFTCSLMRWLTFGKMPSIDEVYKKDAEEGIINSDSYLNDRVTVTVTFEDGEELTQVIELKISEETYETSLKILE